MTTPHTQHGLAAAIRDAMRAAFPRADDPALDDYYKLMEYHLGWRDESLAPAPADTGKLIRPQLALLACRALGGDDAHALPLAAAVQLLHDFSLIHDDIEDHSEQRRGRTTLWKLWGLELGINAGDGMFAIAHRSLHRLPDVGVEPATALAVMRGFEEAVLRICEGQHLDLTGERRFDIDEARYLRMIRGKTAALIAASTGLGARLATDDPAQVRAMSDFGEALGLAFQMQDDLLDIWGDPELTGKPAGDDLLSGKPTVIVSLAQQRVDPSVRPVLDRAGTPELTEDDVALLQVALADCGVVDAVEAMIADHLHTALSALDDTVLHPEGIAGLTQMAHQIAWRTK